MEKIRKLEMVFEKTKKKLQVKTNVPKNVPVVGNQGPPHSDCCILLLFMVGEASKHKSQ